MRPPFSFKEFIAAVAVSAVIAGCFVSFTALSAARTAPAGAMIVNRIDRGDRVPAAGNIAAPADAARGIAAPNRVPLGCDPAFSPIANPDRAHIFMRCLS